MLPDRKSRDFPEALKAAREAKSLSFKELATLCGISQVMPSRYENRDHSNFGYPSFETWKKLNTVLFGIQESECSGRKYLDEATTDDLIMALKKLGATAVKLEY